MSKGAVAFIALAAVIASAAEQDAQEQAAIQATLARYFRAVNTCDTDGARAETVEGYKPQSVGLPAPLLSKISGGSCAQAGSSAQFAVLARTVHMINQDTALADGFFRTAAFTPARAGRAFIVFLRQAAVWKVGAVRLAPIPFEAPNFAVPVAATHEEPGADGWTVIDSTKIVELNGSTVASAWQLDGGTIHSLREGGSPRDIRTRDSYTDFELRFEWKVSPAANSGIKYRLFFFFDNPGRSAGATGSEYQIVDNEGDPGASRSAVERAASLYNQVASVVAPRAVGEWNEGAVIVKGNRVEHWLNGEKALELECESSSPEGPIVFQHHGGGAWLRNIRIRRLK